MASRHVIVPLLCVGLLAPLWGCGSEGNAGAASAGSGVSGEPASARDFSPGPAFVGEPLSRPEESLFVRVDAQARSLASSAFEPPPSSVPRELRELTYDRYRSIRYRPEEALWRDQAPFEIQLFHPGLQYDEPVAVHLVEGDAARAVEFRRDRFRYEGPAAGLEESASDLTGYAGFRVHYPMNDTASKDEVAVFLGASYFRLLGPGQVHGLSGRGVAVDTGSPRGEEFPAFREFWLVRPAPDAASLLFYALLDGPSLAGAYRFELTPGTDSRGTRMDVEARLYARRDVEKLGVAPLTSMFLFDSDNAGSFDDYRSRVHDSHGLLARTGRGEWIWRPLSNGPGLRVTSLRDVDPAGFGLAQRVRDFDRYLDLEARYDRRPSLWVRTGEGHWGEGGVELMEIPTTSEFTDNVVAYWAPDAPFRAGEGRLYRYRLETFGHRHPAEELLHVERTRTGWDALPGEAEPPSRARRRFVVDFRAHGADDGGAPPEAILSTTAGTFSDRRVRPLPDGGWRVTFAVEPDGDRPADMRLYLERDGRAVSETWSYAWYPERGRGSGAFDDS